MPEQSSFVPPLDIEPLVNAKLASSGLSPEHGALLGMSGMLSAECSEAGLWHAPALRIPYYDPWTGAPYQPAPEWPPFYRARYLGPEPYPDAPKYLQPTGTGSAAYFPHYPTHDWSQILCDPNEVVIITEGELKAAKGCVEGFVVVGLGGVNSISSKQLGVAFLSDLEKIFWPRRSVVLCFDSDIVSNTNVCKALWHLAECLKDRGAIPYMLTLPNNLGAQKTGLDDFLCVHDKAAFQNLLDHAQPLTVAAPFWHLNSQYAVIKDGDCEIVDLSSGARFVERSFRFKQTANTALCELTPKGVSFKQVNVGQHWLDWPLRNCVETVDYAPNKPPLSISPDNIFNSWSGWGCVPSPTFAPADLAPFHELLDYLFEGSDPTYLEWFRNWLAAPLQDPGLKMFSAVVLFGLHHGTGKTLVAETMGRIYGKNYVVIGQEELKSQFNEWAARRQFILADDVTGIDRLEVHDKLKTMVTRNVAPINGKGVPQYYVPDHANIMITTNRPAALWLDDGDRRFAIFEVLNKPKPRQFFRDYMGWLDNHNGAASVFSYLLSLDLTEFDSRGPAMVTKAKSKMRESARGTIENWVSDLKDDPDNHLEVNGVKETLDLFTNKRLRYMFSAQQAEKDDPRFATKMGAALSALGFEQVHGRRPVTGRGIEPDRYYAIRNAEKWLKAPLSEIQDHLLGIKSNATNNVVLLTGKNY